MRWLPLFIAATALSGCAAGGPKLNLPTGAEAYNIISAQPPSQAVADYRIGPLDAVDITVFQEEALSVKAMQVDASGRIAMPLIGTVQAAGKTASELSNELETRLEERYLRNPQVTITVATSVSQKVSVQGEVIQPGVYPITGPTTLLDVISLAKGETQVATLREVVVFRNIGGQRMGAVFDVASIRKGQAADPVIQGNDLVVVGDSAARKFWRDIASSSSLFNIFRPF